MNTPDWATPPLPAQQFSPTDIAAARQWSVQQGFSLTQSLQAQAADAPDFLERLAATVHMACISLRAMNAMESAFDLLPHNNAIARECLLFRDGAQGLVLVIADPLDMAVRDWADQCIAGVCEVRLALRDDILAYLTRHEESMRATDGLVSLQGAVRHAEDADAISLKSISEDASPVVRLVNSTLYDALKVSASDIHLETANGSLFIKFRVDGVLSSVGSVSGAETAEQVVSRIKVMAELDIAERRVPQDGRFKISVGGRNIDIRVSIMPSIHGEDAVLRILDKERLADEAVGLRLEALGFDAATMASLRRLSVEPYGMLLATGPTGSGKTTTLYAAINEINHGRDKIITIEDPVEYQLPGVLQIPVNDKKGLTFARGLRSILRHDPDKIMVGEIRDGETAQIAVQAALTGHLVLTTVHANNVFDVLGRFTHMGVDPYSLVAALNGIVAQRLVRISCPHCSEDVRPEAALLASSGVTDISGFSFKASRGCAHCRGTGFKGRKAVAEVLILDDELRELIVTREPVRRVKEAAYRKGTRPLREAGMQLVRAGETTLEELNRVVT